MIMQLMPREMPWGDYGYILWNGMGGHLPRVSGVMQLERTGPFIPAISNPGGFVVTSDGRRKLEDSGMWGLVFRKVVKAHIVCLDWHEWDFTVEEPREYPAEGEPEGYILDRPHDPVVADTLGILWEIWSEDQTRLHGGGSERMQSIQEHFVHNPHLEVFRDGEWGATYVSERASSTIGSVFGDLVTFRPI